MYVCIYLSVCTWIYLNSLITHVNTHTNPQTLLCVLQGFLTKYLARTVIWLLTHIFKNHSVTDWKSRRRMLQIGLLLSEIPWVCLSCRDLHRPFKFVLTPVAGLNSSLLLEKVSRFSELSSEFEFWGFFSSNVKVNPVFSWKGQNSFQRILPPYCQHFTTPQISFEFSGFYYASNSFLIKPINTNDRKTCPFREILSQRIGRGEDRVE